MTTTTKTPRRGISIAQEPGQECRIGRDGITVTSILVSDGTYSWTLYRTRNDEWWEGCGNCEGDSGYKPWYGGIYGGVCFQCGGVGARRLAGGQAGMLRLIRQRVSSRRSTLNAAERRAERERAAAEAWARANVNLASDLACVRVSEELGSNVLARLALASVERPLSVRQRDYAISLLVSRAWEAAHTVNVAPLVCVHAGTVGEKITLTGTISVWHYNEAQRYDRTANVLIVLDARNAAGEQVLAKMTTAAQWAMDAHKGDTVTITGTVRAHLDGVYGKADRARPAETDRREMIMQATGTRVRLTGHIWLPDWQGKIGTVMNVGLFGPDEFQVALDDPPAASTNGGWVVATWDDVTILDRSQPPAAPGSSTSI